MPTKTHGKVEAAKAALTVYLPDTRGVTISRWGRGNTKIGMDGVYTYSRRPGRPDGWFEGVAEAAGFGAGTSTGTCPGSSVGCESICYAKRVVATKLVWDVWTENSKTERLPGDEDPLPDDAKLVRIHVSGDFTSNEYIVEWITLAVSRPEVEFFGYTRSWRVKDLLPTLDALRCLPNVQLFASMDTSIKELPPQGWRRAWIEDDDRLRKVRDDIWKVWSDGAIAYICPEETGRKPNCQSCNYCIRGTSGDVVFLLH